MLTRNPAMGDVVKIADPARYRAELEAAGLLIDSCDCLGCVDFVGGGRWVPGETPKDSRAETAMAVFTAHDPRPTYEELRRAEYAKQGITAETLIIALWEKVVERRPETSDAIQKQREAVKAMHPKEI